MKVQFNVELPATLAKRIKKDAIEMSLSLNEYATHALDKFLASPIDSRRSFFQNRATRKIAGRKIAA